MEHGLPPYASLILVVLMAFAVPILTARFRALRIPVVVGEILAGLLVGRSGLGLITEPDPVLAFLSDFGLAYLMFLSGLELNLSALVPPPRPGARAGWLRWFWSPIGLASAAFLATLAIALWAARQLTRHDLLPSPWLAGFILATSALGIVLPTLKERNLTGTEYGQTLLAYASLADFVTMVLMALYVAFQTGGTAKEGELTRTKLDALGHGVFIPMFFITFGAQFDLRSAARSGETWLLVPAFLTVAYASKLIPALLFLTRHSWREAMGGGALVASQLSLTIVAADIGQRLDLFDATTVAAFVLTAIMSPVVSPVVFTRLVPE